MNLHKGSLSYSPFPSRWNVDELQYLIYAFYSLYGARKQ